MDENPYQSPEAPDGLAENRHDKAVLGLSTVEWLIVLVVIEEQKGDILLFQLQIAAGRAIFAPCHAQPERRWEGGATTS
jgi:hypothetical protein